MIAAIALLADQAGAVPPPVEQVAAECARPTYATDVLVCGDPALRALDGRLRSLPAPTASPLLEGRAAWFRRSRRCAFQVAHRTCALLAYGEAITASAAFSNPPAAIGRCTLRGGGDAAYAAVGADGALVRDGVLVGYGRPADRSWRSFLTVRWVGARVTFEDLDQGIVATCRANR